MRVGGLAHVTGEWLATGWYKDGVPEPPGLFSRRLAQACSQSGGCSFPESSRRSKATSQPFSTHCLHHLCLISQSKSHGQLGYWEWRKTSPLDGRSTLCKGVSTGRGEISVNFCNQPWLQTAQWPTRPCAGRE